MLNLTLALPDPVLTVGYHGGTPQQLEMLRIMVERALPAERPDPRRHWRWVGPIFGVLFSATLWLIGTRTPATWSIHTGWSHDLLSGLRAGFLVFEIVYGALVARWLFQRWFPKLERLPDTARTRWDRRRGWVQVAIGVWMTVVIGLLALPAT
jgi:hypothetical protein